MTANDLAPCFFSPSESRALGTQVCAAAAVSLSALGERTYEGGEFKLRPVESVRHRTAFVLQSLAGSAGAPVSERLVRLLFLVNGLRDAGAERVVVLIPYLAFARKDRRTQPRDPVYTRYVAQLLEAAGADRLIGLDVHNAAAFDNAFRIPTDHLTALPMMVDYFARKHAHDELAVVSPDIGGIKRAQQFRELLQSRLRSDVELVFIEKRRVGGQVSGGTVVGNVEGKRAIVIDDLCATGGTLIRAAAACRAAGATAVHAAVTHVPMLGGLEALLGATAVAHVVTTDSVGVDFHPSSLLSNGKLTCLSIAPLLGQAVRRMLDHKALAVLQSRWPVSQTE